MVSSELLRRYPFFAGLTHDQIQTLATVANEESVEAGHYFFHEGDRLNKLFLVIAGTIDIVVGVPDHNEVQETANQILGNFINEDIAVSTVSPGQIFAWSALIPPHKSTAGAISAKSSIVVTFDREDFTEIFRSDCEFRYLMLEKVAGVIRQRLRDMRIQSLAFIPA
ncbi:MAG: cyclic nucleotide-binding domain-containing protein [Candidatus Promineifilaceae bacterium]